MKVTVFLRDSFMDLLPFVPGMRPEKRLAAPQRPSFAEALRFWFKLGWISFGGTAAHIAIMQDELVEKKRWISNGMFLHALSHCMLLPGPEAQQLAIYIGWKLHGKRGGIVAGTLFVLPSQFVLLVLSVIYVRLGSLPWIAAMFNGLKPVVIALVIVALQRVARRALRGPVQGAVAVATFAAMFFLDVSLLVMMFGAIVLGIVLGALRPGFILPKLSDSFDCCSVFGLRRRSQPGFGVTAREKRFDREQQSEWSGGKRLEKGSAAGQDGDQKKLRDTPTSVLVRVGDRSTCERLGWQGNGSSVLAARP
jgi:chromate transport protein ChrA